MWGEPIRKTADGRGIPKVQKVNGTIWNTGLSIDDPGKPFVNWDVTYPGRLEWDCCGETDSEWFDTWNEAIAFALARSWENYD